MARAVHSGLLLTVQYGLDDYALEVSYDARAESRGGSRRAMISVLDQAAAKEVLFPRKNVATGAS